MYLTPGTCQNFIDNISMNQYERIVMLDLIMPFFNLRRIGIDLNKTVSYYNSLS